MSEINLESKETMLELRQMILVVVLQQPTIRRIGY